MKVWILRLIGNQSDEELSTEDFSAYVFSTKEKAQKALTAMKAELYSSDFDESTIFAAEIDTDFYTSNCIKEKDQCKRPL